MNFCIRAQGGKIILITFFDMTPLNPSKQVETAKNACRKADFGLLLFIHAVKCL